MARVAFAHQFLERLQILMLTLVSKKIFIGSFWAWVATILLVYKFITPEIWSMVILALLGMVFGIASFEKVKGVQPPARRVRREEPDDEIPEGH